MLGIFKIPIVRHIAAALSIILGMYVFAIMPLQLEIGQLHKQLQEGRKLIEILAKRDTYSIQNKIENVKSKDGSSINLVPESNMLVTDSLAHRMTLTDSLTLTDSVMIERRPKKWWLFWKKNE